MKNVIGVIILAVICVGLTVVLLSTKKQAGDEKRKDTDKILSTFERVGGDQRPIGRATAGQQHAHQ